MSQDATQGHRLSPQQRTLWGRVRAGQSGTRQVLAVIEGDLDASALRAAIRQVVAKHEILRTRFTTMPGTREGVQLISDDPDFSWQQDDGIVGIEGETGAGGAADPRRARDLLADPPLHAQLTRVAPGRFTLRLSAPALCLDQRSLVTLLQEVARAAEHRLRPAASVQYVDYAQWQLDSASSDDDTASGPAHASELAGDAGTSDGDSGGDRDDAHLQAQALAHAQANADRDHEADPHHAAEGAEAGARDPRQVFAPLPFEKPRRETRIALPADQEIITPHGSARAPSHTRADAADAQVEAAHAPSAGQTRTLTHVIAADRLRRLEESLATVHTSLHAALLACWLVLLRRASGQEDVTTLAFMSTTPPDEEQDSLGPYGDYLRLSYRRDRRARLAEQVRALALDALADWPADRLRPSGSLAPPPLLSSDDRITFDFVDASLDVGIGGARLVVTDVQSLQDDGKLALHAVRHGVDNGGDARVLTLHWCYDARSFDGVDVERLHRSFAALLDDLARRPTAPLERLSVAAADPAVDDASASTLSRASEARTETGTAADWLAHARFEAEAARQPDAAAVVAGERSWTYREVNAQANRLARELRRRGAHAESRVGLCVEHSLELIVGLLGILKAGAAFVPLDTNAPPERLRYVVADAGADLIVTSPALAQRPLLSGLDSLVTLDLSGDTPSGTTPLRTTPPDTEPSSTVPSNKAPSNTAPSGIASDGDGHNGVADLDLPVRATQLAYIIYTSGSTGRPKGVMVQHDALAQYLGWCLRAYMTTDGGAPLHSSIAFDLTITTLLAPLMGGRAVVLAPAASGIEALTALLRSRTPFSFIKLTPAHLKVLNAQGDLGLMADRAGALIVGGEALFAEDLSAWRARAPRMRIINEYGPTEAIVGHAVHEVAATDPVSGAVPIGQPIPGGDIHLLDDCGLPVPAGAIGELYLSGPNLARGYLARPGVTAERFMPDPFSAEAGARLYRTGDLGRRLSDGNLLFLGRADTQIKINGYRVELGEIEVVLRELEGIRDAVVRAVPIAGGDPRLVAYVVADDATASDAATSDAAIAGEPEADGETTRVSAGDESALRRLLQARLQDYMIPWQIIWLPALPLTRNGKVDVGALPVPDARRRDVSSEFVAPLTLEEEVLSGVWTQVLQVDRVGVDDSYFALGGDSIRSIQIVAQAKERGLALTVDELFRSPTIRELADVIHRKQADLEGARAGGVARLAEIGEADRRMLPPDVEEAYPLTALQAGMIFHREYAPASSIYHDISSFHLRAPLDVPALREALEAMIRRHPVLRTSFDMTRFSEPLQLVHRDGLLALEVVDLRGETAAAQEAAITSYFEGEKQRSFQWANVPLIRFGLHIRSERTWQFSVSFHHAILDGWSEATMVAELFRHYLALLADERASVTPPAVRFQEFVEMERRALASPEAQAFWRTQIGGSDLVTLPRRGTPSAGPREIIVREALLAPDVSEGLKRVALLAAVPLKAVLLAAHFKVMSLVSGRRDVVSCVVSSGRPEQMDGDRVLGLFINSIPLRLEIAGGTWVDLAAAAFDVERRALPFRRYPMSEVRRWVGGRPLSESLFYFTHYHVYQAIERFDEMEYIDGRLYEETSFVMASNFRVDPFTAEVHCTLKCDSTQLSLAQVEALEDYYRRVLTRMARDPLGRHDSGSLLSEPEQRQLMAWSGLDTPRPAEETRGLHELFEAQAALRPHEIAVTDGARQIGYHDLNVRANRLARDLRRRGVRREVRVGIYLERTADVVVAILATLKAGGAYVPIDPAYPAPRVAFMLADAGVALVLTEPALTPGLTGASMPAVFVSSAEEAATPADDENLGLRAEPRQAAYVIYTSGSTGTPKGTFVEHGHVTRLFTSTAEAFAFGSSDVWTLFHSYAFDFSVWELWGALLFGGRVVIVPHDVSRSAEEFHALLARERVTVLNQTPSAFRQLDAIDASRAGTELALRLVIFGGEALDLASVRAWMARRGDARPVLVNMYGITETTVHVTLQPLTAAQVNAGGGAASPIGRPLSDLQIHLLDDALQPVPIGVPGEIHVAGGGVSRGYGGLPGLTASRFVPDPFARDGGRLYRSGDLARYQDDGTLLYLGRKDSQVKIRGFRVELGEIEATLRLHAAVKDAAVIVRSDDGAGPRLIAYVVAAEANAEAQVEAATAPVLTKYLREQLPGYMVPAVILFLEELPQTAHGKVDRQRLPDPPHVRPELESAFVAPSTAFEEVLASIWSDVLRIERVGVQDNFFELGGHSLLATQVVAMVREALDAHVPLRALYDAPTVAAFAVRVAEELSSATAGEARALAYPTLTPDAARRYEPFPLTDIQEAYWVGRKAEFELGDTPAHIYLEFQATGLDLARLNASVQRLIARHDMLRVVVLADGRQQVLQEVPPYEIAIEDLRTLSEDEAELAVEAVRDRMSHQKFATEQWPLFEVKVNRLKHDRVRVHFSIDLLVTDADSLAILNRELGALYTNLSAALPPLDITFRDYVLTEQAFRQSERYRRARAYWLERLDHLPPAPDLALAVPLASLVSRSFARVTGRLEPEMWRRLKRRAVRAGLTPSSLLLAAYCEVLSQWGKSPRFTVNVTTYNALPFHPQVRNLVGDFTYLTLVAVESLQPTFEARAKAIQARFLEDMEHNAFSGLQVLRELAHRRAGSGTASMPVVFTSTLPLHTRERRNAAIPAELVTGITQSPQTLIDHQVSENEEALTVRWDYIGEAFQPGMVEEMFAAYEGLLQRLASEDAAWTSRPRAALLPAAQEARRRAINETSGPRPAGLLQDGFWTQAAARPLAVAVVAGETRLTYAELASSVHAVAEALRAAGARPETLVAVVMEKGWEQVAAVLGVVESGAAYLPIEASLPPARQAALLARGDVRLVLTQPTVAARTDWPADVRLLIVTTAGVTMRPVQPAASAPASAPAALRARPGDLAYVIFTSGSTGAPKGVRVDHAAALNTVVDLNTRYAVGPGDRVLALSALGFDLSVYDLFGLLAAGGTVVLPPPGSERQPDVWYTHLTGAGVTLWNSVPALCEMLLEYVEGRRLPPPASLRLVLLSGDWIPVSLPDRLRRWAPGVTVISLGGATEAAIWSIAYPIGDVPDGWTSIPYGQPLRNQWWRVLNANGLPSPDGVPGELYIGGVGLAQGYWRDPSQTATRFVPDPGGDGRLYRTGDWGRYLADGTLEFLGRQDLQVKVHGHRIELGEIESALLQHPDVARAVVTTAGPARGARHLVAYVVPRADQARESVAPEQPSLEQHAPEPHAPAPAHAEGSRDDAAVVLDEEGRGEFKKRQAGVRRFAEAGTPLATPEDAGREAALWNRRSHTRFRQDADGLGAAEIGALLAPLRQIDRHGKPKRAYGSAGGLYPVQVYLAIAADRARDLPGGTYYYDPVGHRLVPLAADDAHDERLHWPANRAAVKQAAFSIFLVADMQAIEPLYGGVSRQFCTIEAGLITQLLEMTASGCGVGLCQVGSLDFDRVRQAFRLEASHVLMHSLVGGMALPEAVDAAAPHASEPGRSVPALDTAALAAHLRQRLPDYMVPRQFVLLDTLPLSANGKLDRQALPRPTAAVDTGAPARALAPGAGRANALEQTLLDLLRQELGTDTVGLADNFFDLGATSLNLVRLHRRLEAQLARAVPLMSLFDQPNIMALAQYLASDAAAGESGAAHDERAARQRESRRRRAPAPAAPAASSDES